MENYILVIEDSKTLAMYEKETLIQAGYNVLVAHDMGEVQRLVDLHKTNIILAVVDINLPQDDDKALLYLLKYNIPSIAITGSFHPNLRDSIIDKNIIDYIVLEDDNQLELLQSTINRVINNHQRRILIVDDSASSRYALKTLLKSQNFTIHEAKDGLEALEILKEYNNIDIALIDYEMPHMDGAKLTRIIREKFSRMELSILAISVHAEPIITIEFLKAGANDFITKPYVKEEVLARIGVNVDLIDQHRTLEREIKDRKKIQKELETSQQNAQSANLAKSTFLATMSHEIRTPMNAILGFVDLLYKEETQKDKLEKLNIIKESGSSLMSIINDILDFSKIESGKTTVEKIHFKTIDAFQSITELFNKFAENRAITIELNLDSKLPENAFGDITKVKQIYSNLLSNAIKFSPENSTVEVHIENSDKDFLLCRVKDQGIGIAPENKERIFVVFEQEDGSTTREFGGSGLGLSISKSFAQMMHGDIYVESELNKGSTFFFTVELFKGVDSAQTITLVSQDREVINKALTPLHAKVLIVEDNKSNQLLMKILLSDLGLTVEIANNGLEAVDAYKNKQYDLILMDENMPKLNGLQATLQIRDIERKQNKTPTPIIAVTANALKGDREKFLSHGMDDYISKPIEPTALEEAIRKHLAK